MADTWKVTFKPKPKSQPTDRARLFVDFERKVIIPPIPNECLNVPELEAYILAHNSLENTLIPSYIQALRVWATALCESGTWDKLTCIMPFIGGTDAPALLPIKIPSDSFPSNEDNLVLEDQLLPVGGYRANGGGYVDLDFTINDLVTTGNPDALMISMAVETFPENLTDAPFSLENFIWVEDTGVFGFEARTTAVNIPRMVYAHFGNPDIDGFGNYVETNGDPGNTYKGLHTGFQAKDIPNLRYYFGDELRDDEVVDFGSPNYLAKPVSSDSIKLFIRADEFGGEMDEAVVSWLVFGVDLTTDDMSAYLAATETLFSTLGKTFATDPV